MTNGTTRETVVGVFRDRSKAQSAVNELKKTGFSDSQIGVVTDKHDAHSIAATATTGNKAAEGAGIGAATGAGVGALWALGIAAAIFPPLGIVAGGTLMAVLASAGIGAAAATLGGALIGMGIPEHEAAFYEKELKAGRTLVTVKAGARCDAAQNILSEFGAYDVETKKRAVAV